jgi:hypothetical protein
VEIRDAAGRRSQDDHMARIPFGTSVVVTAMVTVVRVGSASIAATSSPVPSNRGWIVGDPGPDGDPAAGE